MDLQILLIAAHTKAGTLDLKSGFTSTFASFISISGGASVGINGPLVHFGATVSAFLRRLRFMPKIQHDIIIGSGVAAYFCWFWSSNCWNYICP